MDDLDLWAILDGVGRQLLISMRTSPWVESDNIVESTPSMIPFAPFSPTYISRIFIRGDSDEDDEDAVSAALAISLALTSFSRGLWGTKEHRKGGSRGVRLPTRRTDIDVELASEDKSLESYISLVSALSRL